MKRWFLSGMVSVVVVTLVAACASAQGTAAGEGVYNENCSSCHQTTGQGLPGVFPPLEGHVSALEAAEGGRDYLIKLLLYGLQGEIQVEGVTYNGVMPAWLQLSDQKLAAILNYISTSWGNTPPVGFTPYTPAEVAARRGAGLSAQEVYELRGTLNLGDAP